MKDKCIQHGLSKAVVDEQLDIIIEKNPINPVINWLKSIKRTKKDNPVHELIGNLPVENKEWVKIAMYRWLVQCCAAADMARHKGKHPDAVPKYESVLMFGGAQGLKKTAFIKYLLPKELHKYTKDSVQLNVKDKDSQLNILRCWIPELGELDATFKRSEISELKGFLSNQEDEIRLPYAKNPTIIRRHASCFATVNEERPLKDTTGNRRFLPVVVTGALDYPRDANFDYADMWAFVWDAYTHREQWWLTGEEEALQQEILSHHEDATMESIILDTFKFIDAGTGEKLDSSNRTIKMTNTQIIEYLPKNITNTRASQMGVKKALDGLGVKKTKSRLYLMPPLFPTVMLNHVSDGEIPI